MLKRTDDRWDEKNTVTLIKDKLLKHGNKIKLVAETKCKKSQDPNEVAKNNQLQLNNEPETENSEFH